MTKKLRGYERVASHCCVVDSGTSVQNVGLVAGSWPTLPATNDWKKCQFGGVAAPTFSKTNAPAA
jgi:hypothetical protein